MNSNKAPISLIVGRGLINFLVLMLVLLTPWWLYLAVMFFLVFYLNPYYEIFFWAFFLDALFGAPAILGFPLFFTSCAIVLFSSSRIIGRRLYR